MIVKLPFAQEIVSADLRGMRIRPLSPSAPSGEIEVGKTVGRAVDHPIDGEPLEALARHRRSATIIVPDVTRRIPLPEILPVILERLTRAGISGSATTVLVACGTHPAIGKEPLRELIGSLPPDISVVQHDSRAPQQLVTVGELRPGIPLRLHRSAVETDLLVTLGTVRHHYFAGFGGGPKMVFPGVAGYEEIQANHSMVVTAAEDGRLVRHARCEPGRLRGNPVAEEIAAAADLRRPDMAVCLIEGPRGKTSWVGAGSWKKAFGAAIERARTWFEIRAETRFESMVASGGGAPSDSTLIQAHKGLDAACRFLVPGGQLLYVAAIDRGVGSPAMLRYLDDPNPDAILASLSEKWVQYGHTTLRILEKTSRFRVKLYSRLDPSLARRLGFEPIDSVQKAIDGWREERSGATVAVMASGPVYPGS